MRIVIKCARSQFRESEYELNLGSAREKASRHIEPRGGATTIQPQAFRAVPLMRPQIEAALHEQQPMSGVMFGTRCPSIAAIV